MMGHAYKPLLGKFQSRGFVAVADRVRPELSAKIAEATQPLAVQRMGKQG